ncbi:MAG: hypothetical protein IPK72_21555 [Candidatus Eisenbacteria bacterium]|nr:hypothetical protein [Candidatus Eisenbacteria bacterium]
MWTRLAKSAAWIRLKLIGVKQLLALRRAAWSLDDRRTVPLGEDHQVALAHQPFVEQIDL